MSGDLIPVIVVGGYLGAGKTTLINDFLLDPQGLRATVLVNDFGAINIDADLIENTDGDTIALTNGCACCSIGDSLLEAAISVANAANPPDLVIVEASGVSHPTRIANILMGVAALAPATCLTLVNGARVACNARDKYIGRLFAAQIETADFLSLNRFDEDGLAFFEKTYPVSACATSIGDILCINGSPSVAPPVKSHLPKTAGNFCTKTISVPSPLALETLERWLDSLPSGIERIKGFLSVDTGNNQVKLQYLSYIQGMYELTSADTAHATNSGMIVAIYRCGSGDDIGVPA